MLIKSSMQITQTDFSSGGCRPQDCTKVTQEYLMYFKEFSCNKTENMQVRCVPRFIQRFLSIKSAVVQFSSADDSKIGSSDGLFAEPIPPFAVPKP